MQVQILKPLPKLLFWGLKVNQMEKETEYETEMLVQTDTWPPVVSHDSRLTKWDVIEKNNNEMAWKVKSKGLHRKTSVL